MKKQFLLILSIILVAAGLRLLPHTPNFSPMGAIALFAGAYITNRFLAFVIPMGAMLLGDFFLGFYGWEMLITYFAMSLTVVLGFTLQKDKRILRLGITSLVGSGLFFLITNFAFLYPAGMYSRDFSGIMNSYIAAIPFFRNTAAGDLFYTALLFGGYYLVSINVPSLQKEKN